MVVLVESTNDIVRLTNVTGTVGPPDLKDIFAVVVPVVPEGKSSKM